MKHEHENIPGPFPSTSSPAEPGGSSPFHPLSGAMASLYSTAQAVMAPEHLEALAGDLAAAMVADGIDDVHDSALILALQARVLDNLFNRFVMLAFQKPDKYPHVESIRLALMAQRQSAVAVERLKRHDARLQEIEIKKMRNLYKRSER
jgi:hypothetical protein